MAKDYIPISCSFYDELEIRAMRKMPCEIRIASGGGAEESISEVIVDVYSRRKEEFIRLQSGREIRLDQLISVDGQVLADRCE